MTKILMNGGRKGGGCLEFESYDPTTQTVTASDVQAFRLVTLDGNRVILTEEGGMIYDKDNQRD